MECGPFLGCSRLNIRQHRQFAIGCPGRRYWRRTLEEMLIYGNHSQTNGITVQSRQGPTFFASISDEHYIEDALILLGAANVYLANVDFEDSAVQGHPGTILKITNSRIYLFTGWVRVTGASYRQTLSKSAEHRIFRSGA